MKQSVLSFKILFGISFSRASLNAIVFNALAFLTNNILKEIKNNYPKYVVSKNRVYNQTNVDDLKQTC